MDELKKFYQALSEDEAMRNRLSALNEKYKGAEPGKTVIAEEIAAFAKAEGFEVTTDDLTDYLDTEAKELTEEELENVSGGACKDTSTCACVMGGGGTKGGVTCVCVINGYAFLSDNTALGCFGVGAIATLNT